MNSEKENNNIKKENTPENDNSIKVLLLNE